MRVIFWRFLTFWDFEETIILNPKSWTLKFKFFKMIWNLIPKKHICNLDENTLTNNKPIWITLLYNLMANHSPYNLLGNRSKFGQTTLLWFYIWLRLLVIHMTGFPIGYIKESDSWVYFIIFVVCVRFGGWIYIKICLKDGN